MFLKLKFYNNPLSLQRSIVLKRLLQAGQGINFTYIIPGSKRAIKFISHAYRSCFVDLSIIVVKLKSWTDVLIIAMFLLTPGEMIAFPFSNSFALKRAEKGR